MIAAEPKITTGFTPSPTGPVFMRNAMPTIRESTPPKLKMPWVLAFKSARNRIIASSIIKAPAMLTGRLASDTSARTAAMPPTTPGRIAPGVVSSVMMP